MSPLSQHRISYLDGLRGVAILSVVIFHCYVSVPERLPFGNKFDLLPLRLGWQGVDLFFIISGFVILMTLERCETLWGFLVKRWLRLFPAMLIASVLIFSFTRVIPNDPQITMADFIPGLSFISPPLIHSLTGFKLQSMDSSFWSLYVEVLFYLIFSVAYFAAGARWAIGGIFTLFVVSIAANATFVTEHSFLARAAAAASWLGFVHFGWFACGALFYLFQRTRSKQYCALAVAAGAVSAIAPRYPMAETIGLLIVVGVFWIAIISAHFQNLLSRRTLIFFGFVSYPLYLFHDTTALPLARWVAEMCPWVPLVLAPIPPLVLVVMISWLIAQYAEPTLRKLISAKYRSRSTLPATQG